MGRIGEGCQGLRRRATAHGVSETRIAGYPGFVLSLGCALFLVPGVAFAGAASWTSTLEFLEADDGHEIFMGGTEGVSSFSGEFFWGDTCNSCPTSPDSDFDEDNPGIRYFPTSSNGGLLGGASIQAVGAATTGRFAGVAVYNDLFVDAVSASF